MAGPRWPWLGRLAGLAWPGWPELALAGPAWPVAWLWLALGLALAGPWPAPWLAQKYISANRF